MISEILQFLLKNNRANFSFSSSNTTAARSVYSFFSSLASTVSSYSSSSSVPSLQSPSYSSVLSRSLIPPSSPQADSSYSLLSLIVRSLAPLFDSSSSSRQPPSVFSALSEASLLSPLASDNSLDPSVPVSTMTVNVFSLPIFFIVFRETLEASIIVSVLLSFVANAIGPEDRPLRRRLFKQIWIGALLGFAICICLGAAFIAVWYTLAKDIWGSAEDIWEGVFCLIASILITVMGLAMLRISALQEKWKVKIAQVMEERQAKGFAGKSRKYAMFILPFITVLREGLEAVVFVGGVSLTEPATSFPLAVVCGIAAGVLVGYLIYRGGGFVKIKIFIILSSCLLYLIAAGLFSRAVWDFEAYQWNQIIGSDADDLGDGPGTYDVRKSVWHVNCCNPESTTNGGWGIFNAILGWQNSATIGSVVSYCVFWIVVTVALILMRIDEKRVSQGKATLWRTIRGKGPKVPTASSLSEVSDEGGVSGDESIAKGPNIVGVERDIQNLAL